MMLMFIKLLLLIITSGVNGLELPGSCQKTQYYDANALGCRACSANSSMVPSSNGYSCVCEEQSIRAGPARCRPCNATEVVSADQGACVPRRCQLTADRIVCRKCPRDYISVTQNFDGSPLKEVLCVKCARGFKAQDNACARCEACACAREDTPVLGRCVPRRYVTERPKGGALKVVRDEYWCTQRDIQACRSLTDACVRSFYSSEVEGPCRLWLNTSNNYSLPELTLAPTLTDNQPGEVLLSQGNLSISVVFIKQDGSLELLDKQSRSDCELPKRLVIGKDFSYDCERKISKIDGSVVLSPYLLVDGNHQPIPVVIRKPNGYYVQKGTWTGNKFRRYFLADTFVPAVTNTTTTVYLRTLLILVRIQREKHPSLSLRATVTIEAHYATKSSSSQSVTTTLTVEHHMPNNGILRGLEIWGGVLGALLSLYAGLRWRGAVRRGGPQYCLPPLLAGAVADALYFAAWFSTLHALAAEAGASGLMLSLSKLEEKIITAFIYSAVSLKALKVIWINWRQCQCDIFFLDWSEYNPPLKDDALLDKSSQWRAPTLAREWSRMQTRRRAPPGLTTCATLLIVHLSFRWLNVPGRAYKWALISLCWWAPYTLVLSARWLRDRLLGSPTAALSKVCTGVGLSLMVFEEEYFAHYVHGRNDDTDARSMAGPLAACRIVCAPQLRLVYRQLSSSVTGALGDSESRQILLSRFMASFFERALDGLSWVASERTVMERLLDVELVVRETGNTSTLLHDPDNATPSCFDVTWWGEEWTLGTFDAMVFGSMLISTQDTLLAALVTLSVWRVLEQIRTSFGVLPTHNTDMKYMF